MYCVSNRGPLSSYHPFIEVTPHNKFQISDSGRIWSYINNFTHTSEPRALHTRRKEGVAVLHLLCPRVFHGPDVPPALNAGVKGILGWAAVWRRKCAFSETLRAEMLTESSVTWSPNRDQEVLDSNWEEMFIFSIFRGEKNGWRHNKINRISWNRFSVNLIFIF